MNKGQMMFRVIAGGFLGYTGLSLIKDVLAKKPEHSIGFIATGAVFVLIGAWYLIHSVKDYMKAQQEEQENDTTDEDDTTLVENEEQNVIKTDAAESGQKMEDEPGMKEDAQAHNNEIKADMQARENEKKAEMQDRGNEKKEE